MIKKYYKLKKNYLSTKKGASKWFFNISAIVLTVTGICIGISTLNEYRAEQKIISTAKFIFEKCNQISKRNVCYSEQLESLTLSEGLEKSLQVFILLKSKEPIIQDCHLTAHKMAFAEVSRDLKNWQNIFEKIDPNECTRGFFHGALEAYGRFNKDFVLNAETINNLCSQIVNKYKLTNSDEEINRTCAHPMGHLLLVQEMGDVSKAGLTCSKLGNVMRHNCYFGVFMENIQRDNLVEHGIAEDWDYDLPHALMQEAICNEFSGTAALACWRSLALIYSQIDENDNKLLYRFCQRAGNQEYINGCYFDGAAYLLVNLINRKKENNQPNYLDICSPFDDENIYFECVKYSLDYARVTLKNEISKINRFCNSVRNEVQGYCFSQITHKS